MPDELKRGLPSGPIDMPVKYDGCIDCVKQIYKSEGNLCRRVEAPRQSIEIKAFVFLDVLS